MDEKKIVAELLRPITIFAFLFYGTFCYLVLNTVEIPKVLENIVMVLMGFYFGQRVKKGNGNV